MSLLYDSLLFFLDVHLTSQSSILNTVHRISLIILIHLSCFSKPGLVCQTYPLLFLALGTVLSLVAVIAIYRKAITHVITQVSTSLIISSVTIE